ncbi:ArnT family glycosyltransferase [Chondromyces apiculatus]|uniref:Glycosyltransferase RgtA/B/C/D-like domain-containing protein n=1 Tax=Chondromyces apiculatus DSM 436 TaxID=1192034 RepID=A0A017T0V7_9BACT|nr:glycosyltransferase family 39 protein [Chondromyces apiculatus]EYF02485.1 Hypothetical protein CAP_7107 [Chondromyces apiculatus DSM 436]
MTQPPRSPWVDRAIAAALALGFVALLLGTAGDLGYARDEGFYFNAADRYAAWFQLLASDPRAAVAPRAVDAAWSVNHEHPAFIKSLFALSSHYLHKKLGLFAMPGTSYRFPAMVLSGLGVALVYLWGAAARGRVAGLVAAALFAMMPRYFYQAHLACFDAPVVTVWMLCAYCYWRSLRDGGTLWPLLCGLTFGIALNTKHNSWFLPIVCGAHAAALELRALITREDHEEPRRRALAALGAMALIGPPVLIATWPWIWRDTFARLREYALFHLQHDYYNMEFLGVTYWTPPMPRTYAPVMTAATVPTITLVLAALGLLSAARTRLGFPLVSLAARLGLGDSIAWVRSRIARPRRPPADPAATELLWFLGIAAIYAAWLSPKTPIFGGTKHWMTAYPFLALFAGTAFAAIARRAAIALRRAGRDTVRAHLGRGPLPVLLLAAAVIAAPVVETLHAHPFALSAYTPLVGGAPGAATLGLNRTFWGYTTGSVVDYLNAEVPQRGTVYIHDTLWPSWEMLIRDGRLRRDIRGVGTVAGADFALYHHEQHMLDQAYQAWVALGTTRPAHVGGLDGVPVVLVYRATRLPPAARPTPDGQPP